MPRETTSLFLNHITENDISDILTLLALVYHKKSKKERLSRKKNLERKRACNHADSFVSFLRLADEGIQHSEYFFLLVGWKCFDSISYPGTFNLVPVINYIYEHLICRAFKGVDDCSKLP